VSRSTVSRVGVVNASCARICPATTVVASAERRVERQRRRAADGERRRGQTGGISVVDGDHDAIVVLAPEHPHRTGTVSPPARADRREAQAAVEILIRPPLRAGSP
jgi:hypothetical protein